MQKTKNDNKMKEEQLFFDFCKGLDIILDEKESTKK